MKALILAALLVVLGVSASVADESKMPAMGDPIADEVFAICDGVKIILTEYVEKGAGVDDKRTGVTLGLKDEAPFFAVVFEPREAPKKEKTKVYLDFNRDGKADQVMTFLELEARYETVCALYEAVRKGKP